MKSRNPMSKLTAKARKKIPSKEFAGPKRSYPIEDKSHAKAALSMSARYASPKVKAEVKAKVAKKYPGMEKNKPQTLHQRMTLNRGKYG